MRVLHNLHHFWLFSGNVGMQGSQTRFLPELRRVGVSGWSQGISTVRNGEGDDRLPTVGCPEVVMVERELAWFSFGQKGLKAMMTWWVAGKWWWLRYFYEILWFSFFAFWCDDIQSSSHCFLKIVPPSVQLKCKFRWKEMAVVQIFSNKGPWWLPRERLSCLPLHPRSLTQICSPFSTICGIFEERYWTLSLFRWETNT